MTNIILYPTETVYGLGVNALDPYALKELFDLKGRGTDQVTAWLVRDINDIEKYAELTPSAAKIAERFLPGPLTIVLKTREWVPRDVVAPDGTIGFRISSDLKAQKLIMDFMDKYDAPLTCTSANIHGEPTLGTPEGILEQFAEKVLMITEVIDDGSRNGTASTVVRVLNESTEILREGAITSSDILKSIGL